MSGWLRDQDFFAVADEGYDRILRRLVSGKRYEKTYVHTLSCSGYYFGYRTCECPYTISLLRGDGKMVRLVEGRCRPVCKLSECESEYLSIEFYMSRVEEEGNAYIDHVVGLACLQIFPLSSLVIHTTMQGTVCLVDVSQTQFDGMIASLREERETRVAVWA